jgi:hypothetical protein
MNTPGFRFKDGKLFLFDEGTTCLIESWPSLKAVLKCGHDSWQEFTPLFPLVQPRGSVGEVDVAILPAESFQLAYQRRAAFRAFRSFIPEELAGTCEDIPARQWMMLNLMQASPHAAELAIGNPALVFALSHPKFFREQFSTLEGAAIVAKRRQREVASWVGFPESDSSVKTLSKLVPASVTISSLKAMRRGIYEPHGKKLLSHLPVINAGVVAFAADRELCDAVPMSLLEEVSRTAAENSDCHAAPMLQECMQLCRFLGESTKRPSSLRKLQEWHFDMSRRWAIKNPPQTGPIFVPPLEGTPTIQPILSESELLQEGMEQNNCVAIRLKSVREGKAFIYRVIAPERATMAIVRGPSGQWVIQEIKLRFNREVSPSTLKHANDWLENRPITL